MVIRWAVGGLAPTEESSTLVVASASTSLSEVDLPESGTAFTLMGGRAGAVHGTAGQVLAIVALIPPSVFEVGSSWAVAVLSARSGDAGGATAASLVAVVANVAVRAGDALAALVLPGAFVAVAASAATSVIVAAVSTALVSSASTGVGASTSSCSAVASSATDVGERASVASSSLASSRAASSTAVASASSRVAAFSTAVVLAPVLPRVSVTPVTSTAVVVEAEANSEPLVLEVAPGRVVAGGPAMARSSYVSQIGAAVLRACAVNVRWRGGAGGAASNN